ncbi:MAG: hypothetical protein KGS61_19445, partial [Verrucomicrobia bacterium]|nr:hypothetical protein [Verrucomicrobiota bacterium]
MAINWFTTLVSKSGFSTKIGDDFVTAFSDLAQSGEVDAFIVATEDGFSPLGAARGFFADDLGRRETDIAELANWNRFQNERVTLVGLDSRRSGSRLRGIILAPSETSKCYERFAVPVHGRPYRDFYYNVTFEAIA